MTNPAVQLQNVTKKIGKNTIIDHLSLDILPGEVFGLLGPNGAGKTTTIRMMVGLMAITKGDILIHGQSIRKSFRQAITHVGAIVENPELYEFLTGYQNLQHFANMFPKISAGRIDEALALVGLENRSDDKVRTYSLGMKQRLGLAQALLHQPSVLILDEPTNGLDPAGIKTLREYLRNLAKAEGTAVIISSHLLAEMQQMCDRFAIIQQGRLLDIRQMGSSAQDLTQDPAQAQAQDLVLFTVDNSTLALAVINQAFPQLCCEIADNQISVSANRDTIGQINTLLVTAGLTVYEIQRKTKTLEDLFLEVTGGDSLA